MALVRAAQSSLRLVARVPAECTYLAKRGMALEGAKGFSEGEKAIEVGHGHMHPGALLTW